MDGMAVWETNYTLYKEKKLKLVWWSFLDCFRIRGLIETCFACHIQHLKCIKNFFVPGQFSMQYILIPWYLFAIVYVNV